MNFKKYSSIENSYRTKAVEAIETYFPNEQFVVQEKIHGANFAIYVDSTGVKYAKRSCFIGEAGLSGFYRADLIKEMYEDKVKFLFKYMNVESISIHGEIYGGNYPHKDVPKNNLIRKVQSGIFYSPDIQFIAFDMKVNGDYIGVHSMNALLDTVKVPRLEILKKGTLQECLDYPNDFNSHLHDLLPMIEDNICEGTVVKSSYPKRDHRGNRLILKNKNSKWSEKKNVSKKPQPEAPQYIKDLREIAVSYVTENRLRNVISKLGPIEDVKKAFGLLMKPFIADVIEELNIEVEAFTELSKDDKKLVMKPVNVEAGSIIRNNLMNIIDGKF